MLPREIPWTWISTHFLASKISRQIPQSLNASLTKELINTNSVLHRLAPRLHINRRRRRPTLRLILSRILQLRITNHPTLNWHILLLLLPILRHNHLAWLQYTLRFKARKILTTVCLLRLLLVPTHGPPTCTPNLHQGRKWCTKPLLQGSAQL